MADSYHQQLLKDSEFLQNDKRLDSDLVDKLVLQLNRIYPQILSDKEAQKFRNLGVPTSLRLTQLLAHLQAKGEEACYELYRALHIHAEDVYFSLPTRVSRRGEGPQCGKLTAHSGSQQAYGHPGFALGGRNGGAFHIARLFTLAGGVGNHLFNVGDTVVRSPSQNNGV
ncbi:caspase recruitment domain-containing protein 19 isoform X3 [Arapaima gigas]